MPGAYASVQDVANRWRPLTSAEAAVASYLVDDASTLIRARFPGIDAQVSGGSVDPEILRIVVSGMVKRALIAPEDGVTQESEGTGPFTHAQTFANPMRNVFISAADLVLILGYQPAGQSNGFANDTTRMGGDYYSRVYGW
ncbi:MAG: hypothetical protein JWO67_752 [Streptosporangiaceae bacterium]|nr:hypothetical protein [Streptosporangiaceae bacterium]